MSFFGWLRDLPDLRDLTIKSDEIKPYLIKDFSKEEVPSKYDISEKIPLTISQQGKLSSCTAHAGINLYTIYLKSAGIRIEPLSRLFLYKTTRDLLNWTGDTGAMLRTTMHALAAFGVPPEKYYPYDISKYDEEPLARHYAMAQNYQALTYYRLDPPKKDFEKVLESIKVNLWCNRAVMFGFVVYDSMDDKTGEIIMPTKECNRIGGHAVCACGFDSDYVFKDGCKGAIKFVNSWGDGWGQSGFGFLPFDYVLNGLSCDFWTMMTAEWLDTKQFD